MPLTFQWASTTEIVFLAHISKMGGPWLMPSAFATQEKKGNGALCSSSYTLPIIWDTHHFPLHFPTKATHIAYFMLERLKNTDFPGTWRRREIRHIDTQQKISVTTNWTGSTLRLVQVFYPNYFMWFFSPSSSKLCCTGSIKHSSLVLITLD